jgi:hypothetical protein
MLFVVVALTAAAVMPLHIALAQQANPARLLPDTVYTGETFDVTVNFAAPEDDFNSISLRDVAPDEWNVTADTGWCAPNADAVKTVDNQVSLIWYGPYDNGTSFAAKYKVTVPGDASPGSHSFNVSFPSEICLIYHIEGGGKIAENITGDFQVEVIVPTTPIISHMPASYGFTASQGGSDPENKTLEIWNLGVDTLDWSLTDDAQWLAESPTTGSSTGEHDMVAVSVDIAGVSAGNYSANITITAPGANNNPQAIPVSLYVRQIGPPPPTPQSWLSQYWWVIVAGIAAVVLLGCFLWRKRAAY